MEVVEGAEETVQGEAAGGSAERTEHETRSSAVWGSLHTQLLRSVVGASARIPYEEVRALFRVLGRPRLAAMKEPCAALAFLWDPAQPPADCAALMAGLVLVAREQGEAGRVATALLWLALWPQLEADFLALQASARLGPEEIASEIASAFVDQIASAELGQVRRLPEWLVAATRKRLELLHPEIATRQGEGGDSHERVGYA